MADLLMPKLGLTMTEGLVAQWCFAPGEAFSTGDVLFVVETEKVANDVEAESDGVLETILTAEGETAEVGTVVARYAGFGESASALPPDTPALATSKPDKPSRDAPSARKLMDEHGLSRSDVAGTGRDGRIMKGDVLRVIATPLAKRLAREAVLDIATVQGSGPRGRIKADDVRAAVNARPGRTPVVAATAGIAETAPDPVRLATARRVTAAKRDIPHFYLTQNAEVSALTRFRADINAEAAPLKISVTHLLIRALAKGLEKMPELNRIWVNDQILGFDRIDIGMVAETPDGLRIPVLRDAARTPLDRLAADAIDLAGRARDGSLCPDDVGGGVMAISNVGMFGASSLTPIINPPHAMILGVGAEQALFRPGDDGKLDARRELTLTLACDHRIVDGAQAARFLAHVVHAIEHPFRLLLTSHPTT